MASKAALRLILRRSLIKLMATITPVLSAMICDGMGWFDDVDYKRMVLAFDQIYYLLPKHLAQFHDQGGATRNLFFPRGATCVREGPVVRVPAQS